MSGGDFLKILAVAGVTLAAMYVGYSFLNINVGSPLLKQQVPAGDLQPVISARTLPVVEDEAQPIAPEVVAPKSPVTEAEKRQWILEQMKTKLQLSGAEVVDSLIFDSKALCDAALKKAVAEYGRRGIPPSDMAETAPFPGSTGTVWMLRNGDNLFYLGCLTRDDIDWAAYVHFKP